MGQKVHPTSFRLGTVYSWRSKWFARKSYAKLLEQDVKLRRFLKKQLRGAGVSRIEVERGASSLTVTIFTAKPGLVIGRSGAQAEELKKKIKEDFSTGEKNVKLNIQEIANQMLSAEVVAEAMALELEKRLPFRRVMKQAIDQVMKAGALGVKVMIGGRLNGSEIARSEKLTVGTVPLHTIRAEIDYARTKAQMTYGGLGIKVWINKGEFFGSPHGTTSQPNNSGKN